MSNIIIEITVKAKLKEDEYKWDRHGEHKATFEVPVKAPIGSIANLIAADILLAALENRKESCQKDDVKQQRLLFEAMRETPVLLDNREHMNVKLPTGTRVLKGEEWETLESPMLVRVSSRNKDSKANLRGCLTKRPEDTYWHTEFKIRTVEKAEDAGELGVVVPEIIALEVGEEAGA